MIGVIIVDWCLGFWICKPLIRPIFFYNYQIMNCSWNERYYELKLKVTIMQLMLHFFDHTPFFGRIWFNSSKFDSTFISQNIPTPYFKWMHDTMQCLNWPHRPSHCLCSDASHCPYKGLHKWFLCMSCRILSCHFSISSCVMFIFYTIHYVIQHYVVFQWLDQ